MNHGIFSLSRRRANALLVASTLGLAAPTVLAADAAPELRLLTHSSFGVPKPLLAQFEKEMQLTNFFP